MLGGADAVPIMIPPMGEASLAVLDRLDGLLLPGSPSNVHPSHYDGGDSLTPDHHDLERDATTLRLIREALARGMPLLAICRGIQELNVALGGTLHQKVHEVPERMDHRPGPGTIDEKYAPQHLVFLSGQLARIVGSTKILVNSLHGQAIDALAPGLVVEAHAPDDTIEAVRVERAPASRSACSGTRSGATPTTAPAWRCSARSARRAWRIGRDCERRHEMDLQLTGKKALITGGSKGIGRATAEVLADEGCDVTLVARDQGALDEAAAAIRARRQVNVRTISADLSSDAAVRRVAAEAGELDILVNNAGAIPPGDVLSVDDATWRHAWDLKVFGYISFCRVVYAQMKARQAGVIVNVIGAAGESFPTDYIAGAAGNASLMAFTRALGKGAPADGLRVVAINPGPVETDRLVMLRRAEAAGEVRRSGALARADRRACRSAAPRRRGRSPMRWRFWPARCRATRPGRC